MLNLITKGIAKIFGTKSERDIKAVMPLVEATLAAYSGLQALSDDQLRDRSQGLRETIAKHLADIDGRIADLKTRANAAENSISEKEALFDQLEGLQKERDKELEVVLLTILPEAFAVVKETARRYKENGQLVVEATAFDIEMARTRPHIRIENGQAIWPNRWMAAGNEVVWDMLHYDAQLIGGIVLHSGKISEMATGEGKTLVATLPAFLNALAGQGVHIVTVNDYLARRDSQWMGPLYEFHGLRCDCIDLHEPNTESRRQAYLADITYGTNNEFGFDYLRDNMVREPDELVQRKLHYAMVDEVDSVLIDDARTPLIISGPVGRSDNQIFIDLKPRVQRLYEAQRALVTQLLSEARRKIAEGNEKEGGLALFRAHRALPKNKPLIKFLSEQGVRALLQKTENFYLQDNSRAMPEADRELFFTIDEKNNSVELTGKGIQFITSASEDTSFFVLPVLSTALDAIEKDKSLTEEQQLAEKDRVIQEYTDKAERLHVIHQLVKAYTLFEREVEYIIMDGKVKIVDEQTGRVLEGRRYSDGLHQALEAKENVDIEDATQTYATVTLQNYFRMYHKLAGMTGTAETEAGEFDKIYKLDVVVIPTHRPIVRKDEQDKVYKTTREKYTAVVEEIVNLTKAGRPVLVGTTSVENSELISRFLQLRKIPHNVLNAKQHQREAEIVAAAGLPGTVTIATNMAGRGTDIKLTPESRQAGGLAIIGTERHESRRVDRQLRGRSGRQGDPGTSQFFVSLEDGLMRLFGSDRIIKIMDRLGLEEGEVIQHSMVTNSIERAQRKVEENNFSIRKRLLEYDDVMNSQRNVIYRRRRSALFGDRLELEIVNMIGETCQNLIDASKPTQAFEEFRLRSQHFFGMVPQGITKEDFIRKPVADLVRQAVREVYTHYQQRRQSIADTTFPVFANMYEQSQGQIGQVLTPLTDGRRHLQVSVGLEDAVTSQGRALMRVLEKVTMLHFIDTVWKEHLREMDELRQSVQNASLEQKDPLLVYKGEAFNMFRQLLGRLNEEVLTFLFKCGIPIEEEPPVAYVGEDQPMHGPMDLEAAVANREQEPEYAEPVQEAATQAAPVRREPIRNERPLPNRNDRVNVRYANGEIKRDVKFKSVEEDLRNNRCILID